MAVTERPAATDLGLCFAELVCDEPEARRLWIRQHRDHFEFWLTTGPADTATEVRLYEAGVQLQEKFPTANIRVRLLSPRYFDGSDLPTLIPAEAEEISLRAS